MQTNTKYKRVKYTEQIAILLTKDQKEELDQLRNYLKGTYSQVFRLALYKLFEDLGFNEKGEKVVQ
jgi:hypothetical protein